MSGDNDPVMFNMRDARRIDRVVSAVEQSPLPLRTLPTPPAGTPASIRYWAKTTTTVNSGTLEVPSTFLYDIWVRDPDDVSIPPAFIVSTDPAQLGLTGVNRSSFTTDDLDIPFKMEFIEDEWTPSWVDC